MQRDARFLPLRFLAVALCALVPSLILPACGSTPNSRFYVLTPSNSSPSGDFPTMKVGLEPVMLPTSVDRSQLLMSLSDNRRSIAELDRWAGSLSEDMTRVIGQNLEARLGLTSVFSYPSHFAPALDYIVTIEVLELRAMPDGDCTLIAKFHIADGSAEWITSRHAELDALDGTEERLEGAAGVAKTLSMNLDALSKFIARTLQETAAASSGDADDD